LDRQEVEMTEAMLHTDANAVGGLLGELLAREPTSARRVCPSCGARAEVGTHRVYIGAGTVLRCPACGDLAARVSVQPRTYVVELRGVWVFDA
jgi:Family of unknown function (DUF6510)